MARYERYAAVIHAGGLSWWRGLSGLSGGALSAFWTPEAGSLLLGRVVNRPFADRNDPRRDSWEHVERWQTHAVSGRTAEGKAFSTARIRDPHAEFIPDAAGPGCTVVITGVIGADHDDGRGCEPGAVGGSVRHTQRLILGPDGIRAEHELEWATSEALASAWISLPLFEGHPGAPPRAADRVQAECWLEEEWRSLTAEWSGSARRVRLQRHGGGALITLDADHRMRLGPMGPFGRPLLIEIGGAGHGPRLTGESLRAAFRIAPLVSESSAAGLHTPGR